MKNFKYTVEEISDKSSFVHNFEVSVVMPFFKKYKEFENILPKNSQYFSRNGIEVVIVMDEDSEEELVLQLLCRYPEVNWKVLVNKNKHDWRNPAKAINVGIRQSSKDYILVCSPESEFATDVIYIMRKTLHFYPNHFTIGYVEFRSHECVDHKTSVVPYGSIMAKKSSFEQIGGYDESLFRWGGDDDNIRARLEMFGCKKISLKEARLVHWESSEELSKRKNKSLPENSTSDFIKRIFYPNHWIKSENWGHDFDNIVYDWQKKKDVRGKLKSYLAEFNCYQLTLADLELKFRNILLVQSYNECEYIIDFLNLNGRFFDAIILLDDNSTDGTFELAKHEKLILKVQKTRLGFDDLLNRNILLKLASYFNSEWLTFLDVDELIDFRFSDFSFMNNTSINVIAFRLVHLWDSNNMYNKKYPFSNNGIQVHFRMFRNIGFSQILTTKKNLHFQLAPYVSGLYWSDVLILHKGHMEKSKREAKFYFYKKEDKFSDQIDYSHLIKHNTELGRVDDISIQDF